MFRHLKNLPQIVTSFSPRFGSAIPNSRRSETLVRLPLNNCSVPHKDTRFPPASSATDFLEAVFSAETNSGFVASGAIFL